MSIAHRATGTALYVGTVLLAIWLVMAASGQASFDLAQSLAGSALGRFVLFGYTFALLHHMLGGLRHFVWDLGHGFDHATRMALSRNSLIVSSVLTVLLWIVGTTVL